MPGPEVVKGRLGPHRINTVSRRITALSLAHDWHKVANPCRGVEVKTLLSKARRAAVQQGQRPIQKQALTLDLLDRLLIQWPRDNDARAARARSRCRRGPRTRQPASAGRRDGAGLADI